jgi:hypothetical protein
VSVEQKVESKRHNYRGKLDRVFRGTRIWKGLILMDIKTSKADTATRLQTAAYRLAWREMNRQRPIRRGSVELHKDGKYKCALYDQDDYDEAGWLACLTYSKGCAGISAWRAHYGMKPMVFKTFEA